MNRSGAHRPPSPRAHGAVADAQGGAYRHRAMACVALGLFVPLALLGLLSGCARKANVQPVLAERCLQLGGQRQEITVPVPVRTAGLLHVAIRERGISAAAEFTGRGANRRAESPIDRLATIDLTALIRPRDLAAELTLPVHVVSVDSRDITADVCISAEISARDDSALARAELNAAAADRAVAQRQWQRAFDSYLAAARLYDAARMANEAAEARTAMAQLDFAYMRNERDGLALAMTALSSSGDASPQMRAVRLALIAKILLRQIGDRDSRAKRIDAFIRSSERLFRSTSMGQRELPRLEMLSGFLQYRLGKPDLAAASFDRAAEECRKLSDWGCFAGARQNLAAIAEDEQNFSAALADYSDAFKALDASRNPMLAASIADNLGRLQGRTGLIRLSEQSEQTAMRLYAQLSDCDGVRRVVSTLGEMLVRIGSIGDSAVYLDQAATLDCRDLLSAAENSRSQIALGGLELHGIPPLTAQFDAPNRSALCTRRPSLNALSREGNVAVFHALLAASQASQLANRLADAERCLDLATSFAATDIRSEIRLANADGELLLRLGKPSGARTAFRRALQLSDRAGLGESSEYLGASLLGLGDAALQSGDLSDSLTRATAALRLSTRRADVSRAIAALRLIAEVDRRTGRSLEAKGLLRSAIRLMEQVPTGELDPETRAMYLATQHAVYAELTDLLAGERQPSVRLPHQSIWEAFSVADEGHARSLRYAVDQSSVGHAPQAESGAAQRYRKLMQRFADLSTKAAAKSQQRELVESVRQLGATEPIEASLDPTNLAQTLEEKNATLVEYAAGQGSLLAFVVDAHDIHVINLGDLDTVDRLAGDFIAQLRSLEPNPDGIRAAARRLAQEVLWPIVPYIRYERLFLVPEDALHTVPFAAMPWSSTNPDDLLIRHVEISVLPSAHYVEYGPEESARTATPNRFVLIGDPVLRSTTWKRTCAGADNSSPIEPSPFEWMKALPSLPGTRAEVLGVASLLRRSQPSTPIVTLLGCAATPAALQANAPHAELLHIATHGLVDARRPRLSALILTPDSSPMDDGTVQLLDILRMRVRARLVVLSACDTSAGRLLPGEGVLGLAQAFLQSGAESVVASYWRVEDSRTALFMENFYRNLLINRLPAAAALRQAQLEQATPNDYSWAAFGLYGRSDVVL